MYAIFEDGGKQYKVGQGDHVLIETRGTDDATPTDFVFDKVLMIGDGANSRFGAPLVPGATVTAKLVTETRMPKAVGVKFRRRKGYKRKFGHRQPVLRVEITGISA
ncbi:MAG: 50S ribosomal protein L21 [Phycisphaerales bacterium]|nr:50S ribosomal protein L21 [Phycisphaerales bacterium]